MTTIDWPVAHLSTVARARAIAAGLPGSGCAEILMDVPFAQAWPRLMDLERSVPDADRGVRSIHVRSRTTGPDGAEQLVVTARTAFGLRERFDVRIEEGWCLMRGASRLFVVVMAAEPDPADPTRTRYVHVEAVPRRGAGPLRPLLQWMVAGDVRGFRRHVER